MIDELHADVFAPLHGRRCSTCRPSQACHRAISLDRNGEVSRGDDKGAIVSWPCCPGLYIKEPRPLGQDLTSIGEIIGWAYERGVHRSEYLGAGGHRLLREWHRCREIVPQLIELRGIERRKKAADAHR